MWEANERQKLLEIKTTKISKYLYFAGSIEHDKNKYKNECYGRKQERRQWELSNVKYEN